jgi:hypothetical protein
MSAAETITRQHGDCPYASVVAVGPVWICTVCGASGWVSEPAPSTEPAP